VRLGHPRLHLRETTSTNDHARALAAAGAPVGTIVTTGLQTAGRGRQGRIWTTPPGRALLLSVVVPSGDPLLPLRAGLAVADLAGPAARVKWPNDVLVDGRKVAGILVEGRPQEGWAVVGMGVNVALRDEDLVEGAGSLGRAPGELDDALLALLRHLERRIEEERVASLAAVRERDALLDRPLRWSGGEGSGAGIDEGGGLRVRLADGHVTVLDAGEVHLVAG
jgi:BirA family transcriptional regulator, biotin operon repressor / biotin---[acetyl-CoA-carboxylase] ligase